MCSVKELKGFYEGRETDDMLRFVVNYLVKLAEGR